jgi:hypothetical protein
MLSLARHSASEIFFAKKEGKMPKEIYPSSYQCDCGHISHFSENTIREIRQRSHKRKMYLADSELEEHTIVFYKGEMIDILCPKTI